MKKSQKKSNVLVKVEPNLKVEESDAELSEHSLVFPKKAYLSHESSLESSNMTEGNVSIFEPPQVASRSAKGKSKKYKNSTKKSQKLSQNIKQEHFADVKIQDGVKKGQENVFRVKKNSQIGIETSAEFNEEQYLQKYNKMKGNRQKRVKKETTEEKHQISKEVKEQVKINESSEDLFQQSQNIDIPCLASKCQYHIIDFKYIATLEDFDHKKDILYLLVPKFSTKDTEKKKVPKEIFLKASEICQSQKLFIELLRFYQNLGNELDMIPQLTN